MNQLRLRRDRPVDHRFIKGIMKTILVQHLLLVFALISVQIVPYTESLQDENRFELTSENKLNYTHPKDYLCKIYGESDVSDISCTCTYNEGTVTEAVCWVFEDLDYNHTLWSAFDSIPHLESLTFIFRPNPVMYTPLNVINSMKRLKNLNILYNMLSKIETDTFSNMTTLRQLTLRQNDIAKLEYASFSNLPSLVNLTINENNMTQIQREVFVDLPNLNRLDLSQNGICLAHDGVFEHLTVLQKLDLGKNSITELARGMFRGLVSLTSLNLRLNYVSMIGDFTFTELSNLKELQLDGNGLGYLSEKAFDGLPLLKKLTMANNRLKSLNKRLFEGVRDLDLLDMRNNDIEYFAYETIMPIMNYMKRRDSVFYLSGDKLMCDCRLSWIEILENDTNCVRHQPPLGNIACDLLVKANERANMIKYYNLMGSKDDIYYMKKYREAGKLTQEQEQPDNAEQIAVEVPLEECPTKYMKIKQDHSVSLSKVASFWQERSSYQILVNAVLTLLVII